MKLDKITVKNDEYYTPAYAVAPIIKYIPKYSRVWCPFDTEKSMFVKMLRDVGCDVTATHINYGGDFFKIYVECDYIISNPPFSMKSEVFDSLFLIGKPFAMLIGVVGLFEIKKRFDMFRDNMFEIMFLNKRVSFFDSIDAKKTILNPPFSSVYITSKILPDRIVFEEIEKI